MTLAAGTIFLTIGLVLYLSEADFKNSGTPVSLTVIDMVESSSSKHITYAPKFKVLVGEFAGRSYLGNTYLFPPVHQIGDNVQGRIDIRSGVIKSDKMIARITGMTTLLIKVGIGLLVLRIGYAFYRRYKRYSN